MPGKHRARTPARTKLGYGVAGIAITGAAALLPVTARADVDWGPIIACESGGNPAAQNSRSTASGLFQFLDSSWAAYGGLRYASRARYATPAQQTEIADHAYAVSGLSPWAASRGCWAGKVTVTAAPVRPALVPLPDPPPSGGAYTVRPGDTLSAIGKRLGMDWHRIAAANADRVPNPDWILPGQRLRIPAN